MMLVTIAERPAVLWAYQFDPDSEPDGEETEEVAGTRPMARPSRLELDNFE